MGGTSNYCNENAYRCEVTGYGRLQCTCTLNNIFTKNIIQIKIQIYDVKLTIFTWAKISELCIQEFEPTASRSGSLIDLSKCLYSLIF